jgi:hypothetical protein
VEETKHAAGQVGYQTAKSVLTLGALHNIAVSLLIAGLLAMPKVEDAISAALHPVPAAGKDGMATAVAVLAPMAVVGIIAVWFNIFYPHRNPFQN